MLIMFLYFVLGLIPTFNDAKIRNIFENTYN